jgi:hypothetical protein
MWVWGYDVTTVAAIAVRHASVAQVALAIGLATAFLFMF